MVGTGPCGRGLEASKALCLSLQCLGTGMVCHTVLILSLSPQFTASGAQAVQATLVLPPPSSTRPVVRNSTGLGVAGGSWAVARGCSEQAGWLCLTCVSAPR